MKALAKLLKLFGGSAWESNPSRYCKSVIISNRYRDEDGLG